jgi:erythromycin esterase
MGERKRRDTATGRRGARTILAVLVVAALAACGGGETRLPLEPTPNVDSARTAWLSGYAARLETVDPQSARDDLEALRTMVGEARVVLMGEPSHGDGTAFLAKRRLIRFLHEEMGFDVLVFEGGLYPVAKAWERVDEGASVEAAMANAIYPVWMGSAQVRPLFDYVDAQRRSGVPLEVAGMDSQLWGSGTDDDLVTDLEEILDRGAAAVLQHPRWSAFRALLRDAVADVWWDAKPDAEDLAFFEDLYRQVQAQVAEGLPSVSADETSFWTQVLASAHVQIGIDVAVDPEVGYSTALKEARDRQMGQNLVWLARTRYPDRKLIVWAANYHVFRNVDALELVGNPSFYSRSVTMGDAVSEALGAEALVLGFTAYRGDWGYWHTPPSPIAPPGPGALESYFSATGADFAILDLRDLPAEGRWLAEPLVGRALHYVDVLGRWPQTMDAVFYIESMEPSTPVDAASPVRAPGSPRPRAPRTPPGP